MKMITTFIVSLVLISCNPGSENTEATNAENRQETAPTENTNSTETDGMPAQNGDYTSLFARDAKDCELLTPAEVAEAIDMAASQVVKEDNGTGSCIYILTNGDGNVTRFIFTPEPWDKAAVAKEINSYKENMKDLGEDSRLTHIQLSETGDTYLGMNQNRYIMLLNSNYDGAISIGYSPQFKPTEKDVAAINQRKDTAREQAYALGNYILKKYNK